MIYLGLWEKWMQDFFTRFKLLFILLIVLSVTILFGDQIPTTIKSFSYAISISIKNAIVFILPIIVFIFMCGSLITLQNQAGKFVILLLTLVTISNFIAIMTGYTVGVNILPTIKLNSLTLGSSNPNLEPLWNLNLPQIINIKFAILTSIILGLFFAFKPNKHITHISLKLNEVIIYFFEHYFTPILPLFILGFLLKLQYEKTLLWLITLYGPILLLIISIQLLYITLLYMVAADFKFRDFFNSIKNMMPAIITGFSTSSSAATLPVTILCIKKNLNNPSFAKIIGPATCNIHTIGSAIGITIMALATMQAFNMQLPNFNNFLGFAIYFTFAKYAVAGVPGGAVVVAAPLLELYLGFTPEMIGMVTAVYLLFDSLGTAINISGNGVFAIIFSNLYHKKH